jgi:hypothetical protein
MSADAVGDCKAGQGKCEDMDRELMSFPTALQIGTTAGENREIHPNGRSDNELGREKARREINSAEREGLQAVNSKRSLDANEGRKRNGQAERADMTRLCLSKRRWWK